MARDVNHVVDATHDPEITVLVATRAVAGEICAVDLREIISLVALGVSVNRAQHSGPWLAHYQQAALVGADAFAVAGDDVGCDSGKRKSRGAGLGSGRARHRADHDSAGLGLPPRVDDRASIAADNPAIPHPRFRIDRLAHRTEQP